MYDLEKRQQAAAEREARKAAKQALVERQEREKQAKQKMEEDAYEMQLQVLHCGVALRVSILRIPACRNLVLQFDGIAALPHWQSTLHTACEAEVQVD